MSTTWDMRLARAALDCLQVAGTNREVAECWLSLWQPEGPPTRERFAPRLFSSHPAAIAIFEVLPDGLVLRRLAGAEIQAAFGDEFTGPDLLGLPNVSDSEARRRLARVIVGGAIAYGVRRFRQKDTAEREAAEVSLPFDGKSKGGGRYYLYHTSWRPSGPRGLESCAGLGYDLRILPIHRDGRSETMGRDGAHGGPAARPPPRVTPGAAGGGPG